MPLCFQIGKRFSLQLSTDAGTENRFFFRVLTAAEVADLAGLKDSLAEQKDGRSAIRFIIETIARFMVDWNLSDGTAAVPYEPARLAAILSMPEAMELINKLIGHMKLSEDELGK